MADGTQHRISVLGTAIGTIAGGLSTAGIQSASIDHLAWLVAGELAGMILHPDLDQIEGRRGFSFAKLIFYPYGVVMKHRSAGSHWPIIGTLIRVIYVGVILAIIHLFLGGSLAQFLNFVVQSHELHLFIVGLGISDLVHFTIDFSGIYKGATWRKQSRARRRRTSRKGRRK